MSNEKLVTKRNNTTEEFNPDKIHKVLFWASEGIEGISISEVEIKANIQVYDKMPTDDIHELLIKSAADLISEESPNYAYLAANLINYKLRKLVYGQYKPFPLHEIIDANINAGVYTKELREWYSDAEIKQLDNILDHDRDSKFAYAAMEQWREKYLVQIRGAGVYFETPQVAYILIAATLFNGYPKETRMGYIKQFYDSISNFYLSLPTPIMAGVRTPTKQFSSCVLIECDDSLDSISATSWAIIRYISRKAGIGLGMGKIRAEGSKIRNGDVTHTGIIPFLKLMQASVKSCSQGGLRGGSATVHYPIWHREFEQLLVLKNNKGVEESRVRQMDYSVQINKLFYTRLIKSGTISFFSPSDVPGLYDAFFADQDEFERLYVKYEKTRSISRVTRPAVEVFSDLISERKDTGRIYIQHVDHVNDHGSFLVDENPIRMSNLCQEIGLPTVPLQYTDDPDGEIALCTLAAINWGLFKKPSDMQPHCEIAVRALDALLSYQDYPVAAARNSAMKFRPLGVGIINLAYFLAKRGLKYNEEALPVIDEYAEAWSYYLIEASNQLAIEMGGTTGNTKYTLGIVPIDTYKKEVDNLLPHVERMPWNELRESLLLHGTRNATLMALMPAETSAQISNSTNGIEPIRSIVSYKGSKDGLLAQVAPESKRLKNKYDKLWEQKSPQGYLKVCAILQKYVDQSISVNTSYNPELYPDNKLPMNMLIKDLVDTYKYGLKNLYYFNTHDGAGDDINVDDDNDCADGVCKI